MTLSNIKAVIEGTLNNVYINETEHLHTTFFNCTEEGLHHRENIMSSTYGNLESKLSTAVEQLLETEKYNPFKKEMEVVKQNMISKFKREFRHTKAA